MPRLRRRTAAAAALADVRHTPYWLDAPGARRRARPLAGPTTADLAVVGGGLHRAVDRAARPRSATPAADVVLLEARDASGWAASGRNGGFCSASLTHGLRNGLDRFPAEMADAGAAGPGEPRRHRGDGRPSTASTAASERTGELTVATAPWQLDDLRELPALAAPVGGDAGAAGRGRGARRGSTRRPTSAGCSTATVSRWSTRPGWPGACAQPCLRLGVRIYENTPVHRAASATAPASRCTTPYGGVHRPPGRARHQRLPAAAAPAARPTSCRSGTTRWSPSR